MECEMDQIFAAFQKVYLHLKPLDKVSNVVTAWQEGVWGIMAYIY